MARRKTRRAFGKAEQLKSGKWRARYTWPVGTTPYAHKAPQTFHARSYAEAWLDSEERLTELDIWTPPADRAAEEAAAALTVEELVDMWLAAAPHKASTSQTHRRKLDARVLADTIPGKFDSLKNERVADVDRRRVVLWWQQVCVTWPDEKNTNSAAYKRLRTAFQYAVDDLQVITENPVRIKGAGTPPRPKSRDRPVIELKEAHALTEHTPARLRAGVQLLLWAGLRLGELLELRRRDLVGLAGTGVVTVRVRRNVQRVKDDETGKQVMEVMGTPKTDAGNRDIVLPATVGKALRAHATEFMNDEDNALVITTQTGKQMMDTNFRNRFKTAAELADRPDITPHDCRRFYGTLLVNRGGVSLEEARRLMGHETVEQLMEYQRAARGFERRAATQLEAMMSKDNEGKEYGDE